MGDLRPSFPVRQPSIWRAVDGLAPVAAAEQNARSVLRGLALRARPFRRLAADPTNALTQPTGCHMMAT